MKQIFKLTVFSLIMLIIASCSDEELALNVEATQIQSVADTAYFSSDIQKAASAISPTISSFSGSYGSSIPNSHSLYNKYLLASYSTGSQVILNGSNFGTSKGSVVFEKASGSSWGSTSSYSTSIVSWSNTKIVIKLYSTITSEPIAIARFKVALPNSSKALSKNFSVVNSTLGRLWGECTFHSITRTLQNGLSGWTGAYSNANAKSITSSYVPTNNDVLIWDGKHQAYIEKVTSIKTGDITTYTLNISERNVIKGSAEGGSYSSAIANYTTVVKVKSNAYGTKSFVAGYSTYRSYLSTGAGLVRIQ